MSSSVSIVSRQTGLLRFPLSPSTRALYPLFLLWFVLTLSPVVGGDPLADNWNRRQSALNASSPEWRLTVTDPTYPIRPGLRIIYTILYENIGNAPATNTVIIDTIDAQTEYLLSTKAGIYDPESRTVTWSLGTIEPSESGMVILRVNTPEEIPHGTAIMNKTVISCDEGISSDTSLVTKITYLTILRIYKNTHVTTAYRGQSVTYSIDFINMGDTTATDVLLTDYLPEQTILDSCTGNCELDTTGENVFWKWQLLPPDIFSSVQLSLHIDSTFSSGTILVNKATITCGEASSDSDFCTITIDTSVSPGGPGEVAFDISLKSRDVYVQAGDEMHYRIECENEGPAVAHSVVITDSLPDHTEYLNCHGEGRYDSLAKIVVWDVNELDRREKVEFNLFVRVKSPLTNRTLIINKVIVDCEEGYYDSAAETTVVLSAPAWDLSIDPSSSEIVRGQTVTFTITLRNTGNVNATNTTVTNPIPDFTIYSGNTGEGVFRHKENAVAWNLGLVGVNEERTISLILIVASTLPADKNLVNRAYVQSDERSDSVSIILPLMLPQSYELHQNHPNPFNRGTTITFQIPQDVHVLLRVYNILGQEVTTLMHEERQAGQYSIRWDGKDESGNDLPSGIYLYKLLAGDDNWSNIKKTILIR